jgi:hypothetical protein
MPRALHAARVLTAIYFCVLLKEAVSISDYRTSNDKVITNNDHEKYEKKWSLPT